MHKQEEIRRLFNESKAHAHVRSTSDTPWIFEIRSIHLASSARFFLCGSAFPERFAALPWLLPIVFSSFPTAAGVAHFQIMWAPSQILESKRHTREWDASETCSGDGTRQRPWMQTRVPGVGAVDVLIKRRASTRRGSVYRRFAPATRRTAQGPPLCARQAKSVGIRCGIRYRVARHYAGVETGRAYLSTSAERTGTSREAREHAELGPSAERSASTSSSSVPGLAHKAGDGEQEVVMSPYVRRLKLLRE
ncbi:hypothetical protein B0H19DRAFT_1277092 [Mycena capillaripes]|nr:hypothetical protein B0H19DRAFT_1277092 [Mycena capillaripes]